MNADQLRDMFGRLNVWKRGSEHATHKPLLLLFALARCRRGQPRLISFTEVDETLSELLVTFGPTRKSIHPEYPFWRLQNDGVWELQNADNLEPRKSNKDPKKSELLKHSVSGGFPAGIYELLRSNEELIVELARGLLDKYFAPEKHEQLLAAVGLELGE